MLEESDLNSSIPEYAMSLLQSKDGLRTTEMTGKQMPITGT